MGHFTLPRLRVLFQGLNFGNTWGNEDLLKSAQNWVTKLPSSSGPWMNDFLSLGLSVPFSKMRGLGQNLSSEIFWIELATILRLVPSIRDCFALEGVWTRRSPSFQVILPKCPCFQLQISKKNFYFHFSFAWKFPEILQLNSWHMNIPFSTSAKHHQLICRMLPDASAINSVVFKFWPLNWIRCSCFFSNKAVSGKL